MQEKIKMIPQVITELHNQHDKAVKILSAGMQVK